MVHHFTFNFIGSAVTLAATAALLAVAPTAQAQNFDAVRLYGAAPGQDGGSAGLAVIAGREYAGSDDKRTLAVPVLDYQWANGWFAGVTNGVGYNFSSSPALQYGLRLTADFGRKASRSDDLRGMGDIDSRAEFGGFFNYALPSGFGFTSSLRYGAGNDRKGLVVDLGARYSTMLAEAWRLSVGTGLSWANAEHLQSEFGVSAAQAITSGYRVYTPEAGLREWKASVALSHTFSRRVNVTGALSATTLAGDAADSPLTRKKSALTGLLAVTWAF